MINTATEVLDKPLAPREAWLLDRRTGIGGSDCAAAVGLSKWKTPLELYLDKRGELTTIETEPMRWGNLLEPTLRQEYCNRTGRTVEVPHGIIRHPRVAFAIMTPDGIADRSRVLQCKTSRTAEGWGEPGSADIPQEYICQVQHEMFVTQLPVADVAVLIGGSDFRIYEIPADAELQSMLIEHEAEFWQCVLKETPPAPVSREDLLRRWPISREARVIASDEVQQAANNLAALKLLIATAEKRADDLAAAIQASMEDAAEIATVGGEVLATWKTTKGTRRLDMDAFKAAHPDIYAQFLSDPKPQRRFLLKAKGETCLPELLHDLMTLTTPPALPQP